jgi:hypothetical protein
MTEILHNEEYLAIRRAEETGYVNTGKRMMLALAVTWAAILCFHSLL